MRPLARALAALVFLLSQLGLAEVVFGQDSWSVCGYGVGFAVLGGTLAWGARRRWSVAGLAVILSI